MKKLGVVAAVLGCVVSSAYGAGGGDANAKCEDALNKANYKAASTLCRAALSASSGSDSETHVRALINMSALYSDRGQDGDATPLIQQAMDAERASTAGNAAQARNLDDLGVLLQQQSRYDEAEAAYKKALDIQEKTSPDSTDLATTLTYLGVLLRQQHKFDKAVPYFQRALDIDQKKLGDKDPTTVLVGNDLADVQEQAKSSPVIRYNNTPQVVQPAAAAPATRPAVSAPAAAPPASAPAAEPPTAPTEPAGLPAQPEVAPAAAPTPIPPQSPASTPAH